MSLKDEIHGRQIRLHVSKLRKIADDQEHESDDEEPIIQNDGEFLRNHQKNIYLPIRKEFPKEPKGRYDRNKVKDPILKPTKYYEQTFKSTKPQRSHGMKLRNRK